MIQNSITVKFDPKDLDRRSSNYYIGSCQMALDSEIDVLFEVTGKKEAVSNYEGEVSISLVIANESKVSYAIRNYFSERIDQRHIEMKDTLASLEYAELKSGFMRSLFREKNRQENNGIRNEKNINFERDRLIEIQIMDKKNKRILEQSKLFIEIDINVNAMNFPRGSNDLYKMIDHRNSKGYERAILETGVQQYNATLDEFQVTVSVRNERGDISCSIIDHNDACKCNSCEKTIRGGESGTMSGECSGSEKTSWTLKVTCNAPSQYLIHGSVWR